MISASGEWDPITPILNSLVLELLLLLFLYLYSFDGLSFAMNERMTKNRSAVSRTLPPSLVGRARPCIASDLQEI